MSDDHCQDCCCARSWAALGVTAYDGRSIPEHIDALRADLEALVPLARWGLQEADGVMPEAQGKLLESEIANARVVLARLEKEKPDA